MKIHKYYKILLNIVIFFIIYLDLKLDLKFY